MVLTLRDAILVTGEWWVRIEKETAEKFSFSTVCIIIIKQTSVSTWNSV